MAIQPLQSYQGSHRRDVRHVVDDELQVGHYAVFNLVSFLAVEALIELLQLLDDGLDLLLGWHGSGLFSPRVECSLLSIDRTPELRYWFFVNPLKCLDCLENLPVTERLEVAA